MSVVLAIDQGTTGSTALVFDRSGVVRGRAYREIEQHYPRPGWVEHDPLELWQVSREVMVAAFEDSGVAPSELAAIGITNQRETTIVWDRNTGEPVHRAVVWQSRQTAEICARMRRQGHEPLFRERTGLLADPYFSGTKIRWILEAHPELQARAEAGELAFGTVDSWLLWHLAGGAAGGVHRTDATNASRTLLYDIHEQRWDAELADLLGVPLAMLPEVRPSAGVFAETAKVEGLPSGVPVAGIAGDQQAALFGQGCWQRGQAKNTYGTGCFMLMHLGQEARLSSHGLLTTICCDDRGQPAYALEGSIFVAGAAIQWLRDRIDLIDDAAETEAIARSLDGNDGVYLVPAFAGLGAPHWDMAARGAFVGMTLSTTAAHLVRATLESIAFQSLDVGEAMQSDSGVPLRELRVDGGAARNDFLMQFQADLLGVPVQRPDQVESTAVGAAHLAGLATGVWGDAADLEGLRVGSERFEPAMDPDTRGRLRDAWREAVARVRSNDAVDPAESG